MVSKTLFTGEINKHKKNNKKETNNTSGELNSESYDKVKKPAMSYKIAFQKRENLVIVQKTLQ